MMTLNDITRRYEEMLSKFDKDINSLNEQIAESNKDFDKKRKELKSEEAAIKQRMENDGFDDIFNELVG